MSSPRRTCPACDGQHIERQYRGGTGARAAGEPLPRPVATGRSTCLGCGAVLRWDPTAGWTVDDVEGVLARRSRALEGGFRQLFGGAPRLADAGPELDDRA